MERAENVTFRYDLDHGQWSEKLKIANEQNKLRVSFLTEKNEKDLKRYMLAISLDDH